jgi:hypothetical protein
MIRSNILALLLVAGLASSALAASDAGRAAAIRSSAAQTTTVATASVPHASRVKFHGAVVDQTATFITVSNLNPDHLNELRTFTFSPQLKPKMQRILDAGGYQHGDKVVVTSLAGSKVALDVRGRHSKPA